MFVSFLLLLAMGLIALIPAVRARQWKKCVTWCLFALLAGTLIVFYFSGAGLALSDMLPGILE